METTAQVQNGISKISAKRFFFQALLQKILASADKIAASKILPEPLQNRGVASAFLLCKNAPRIPPAPVKNALKSIDFSAFFVIDLCDLSQWKAGGIGAKASIAAG